MILKFLLAMFCLHKFETIMNDLQVDIRVVSHADSLLLNY